jgi:hypothetical protein
MGWVVNVMFRPRFSPGERTPALIGQESVWAPVLVWTQRLEEKSFRLCRGSNLDRPVVPPVARHYTDWATRLSVVIIRTLFIVKHIFSFFGLRFAITSVKLEIRVCRAIARNVHTTCALPRVVTFFSDSLHWFNWSILARAEPWIKYIR